MENGKKVFISIYEEVPSTKPVINLRLPNEFARPRALPQCPDRRAMLLAYSQQLRKCNEQQRNLQQPSRDKLVSPPEWKKFKTEFKDNHGIRSRWKFPSWIRTLLRKRRRDYKQVVSDDQNETMEKFDHSCCGHWWHVLGKISSSWRRDGGMMGCYKKLS